MEACSSSLEKIQTGSPSLMLVGHYIITVMRSDRTKYAIDTFGQIAQATAEESKATAQGTITYFGTYSVSESDRIIAIHVEAS